MSQPDYEAAEVVIHGTMADVLGHPHSRKHCNCRIRARAAVDAAIGESRLVSPTAILIEDTERFRADLEAIWHRGFRGWWWDSDWVADVIADLASSQGVEP